MWNFVIGCFFFHVACFFIQTCVKYYLTLLHSCYVCSVSNNPSKAESIWKNYDFSNQYSILLANGLSLCNSTCIYVRFVGWFENCINWKGSIIFLARCQDEGRRNEEYNMRWYLCQFCYWYYCCCCWCYC